MEQNKCLAEIVSELVDNDDYKETTLKEINTIFDENVIGAIDFGDGEFSAAIVAGYDNNKETDCVVVKDLVFDSNHLLSHHPNILVFDDDGKKAKLELTGHLKKTCYQNFKRCPGKDAEEKYGADPQYTYADLMAHSFAAACALLFERNEIALSKEKKQYIFCVGRPSSQDWKDSEEAYLTLLRSKLSDYLVEEIANKISLCCISESRAAIICVKASVNGDGDSVLLIDLGSSTVDSCLITKNGVLYASELSYNFGGGKLDEQLVSYAKKLLQSEITGAEPISQYNEKFCLRRVKESYFAPGDSPLTLTYGIQYKKDNTKNSYFFNPSEYMEKVLANQSPQGEGKWVGPVLVPPARGMGGAAQEYDSWELACKEILADIKAKTDQFCTENAIGTPKTLILTGGVSNMECVRTWARDAFGTGCKLEDSDEPSLTVSRGAAKALGTEVVKAVLCRDLLGSTSMEDIFGSTEDIQNHVSTEAARRSMKILNEAMETWANNKKYTMRGDIITCVSQAWKNSGFGMNSILKPELEKEFKNSKKIAELKEGLLRLYPQSNSKSYPFLESLADFNLNLSSGSMDYTLTSVFFYDGSYAQDKKFGSEEKQKILKAFKVKNKDGGENETTNPVRCHEEGKPDFQVNGLAGYFKLLCTTKAIKKIGEEARQQLLERLETRMTDFLALNS